MTRDAERARILAALADELLAQRAAQAPAQGRRARNEHFDMTEKPRQPSELDQNDTVAQLLRRLAMRDETGAGSGEGG